MNQNKSDVELFWDVISKRFGVQREWHSLSAMEQNVFIDGINRILAVIHGGVR